MTVVTLLGSKLFSSLCDFMLDKTILMWNIGDCLLQKGLALMTVALTGKDVALAGFDYRGQNSRELLIEKFRALRP